MKNNILILLMILFGVSLFFLLRNSFKIIVRNPKQYVHKRIETLNALIQVHNDRIVGYENAINETQEVYFKILFTNCIRTSQVSRQYLIDEVVKMGGQPIEGTKTAMKFYAFWMKIKANLTQHNGRSILNSCLFGESIALRIYESKLKNSFVYLEKDQQAMIKNQYATLNLDGEKLKELQNFLVAIR